MRKSILATAVSVVKPKFHYADFPVTRHVEVGDFKVSPRDKSAMCQSPFVVSCRARSQNPLERRKPVLVADLSRNFSKPSGNVTMV